MQSVSITTDVVSSNFDQGEVYNIMNRYITNLRTPRTMKLETSLKWGKYEEWQRNCEQNISCLGGVVAKNTNRETKNLVSRLVFYTNTPSNMIYLFNYTEYYLEHWLNKYIFCNTFCLSFSGIFCFYCLFQERFNLL